MNYSQQPKPKQVRKPTIKIEKNQNPRNATYTLYHEDHTLGNSLRHILMKDKEVEFCGYTIPHPITPELKLRLQTKSNAHKVLDRGLHNLMDISRYILMAFDKEMKEFEGSIDDKMIID